MTLEKENSISIEYDAAFVQRIFLNGFIPESLTTKDKEFSLSVKNCEPDWGIYDFERFPAVQWKLQNLRKLKSNNPEKHKQLYEALKEKLETSDA